MSSDEPGEELTEELKQVEAFLRRFSPAARLDRDRLMYLAGQASVFDSSIHIGWPGSNEVSSQQPEITGGSAASTPATLRNVASLTWPSPTRREGSRQSATGVASYRRFGWPLATAASLLLAMTFGGMLILSQRPGERIVYVDRPMTGGSTAMISFPSTPADSSHASPSDQNNYLQLRNLVLTRGVESLPAENKTGGHQRAEQTPTWPMLRQQLFKTEKDGGST